MKIRVEFVDVTGRYRFSEVEMDDTQLPPSFEPSTEMHLGDLDFVVVRAEPADFRKTGFLRLELHPYEQIDPSTLLCSLPTVHGSLPPLAPWRPDCLVLLEDDWRQIELVTPLTVIDQELAGVRQILESERVGVGFRTLHVRELPEPLTLSLGALEQFYPSLRRYAGVTFRGAEGVVQDGFAWESKDGLVVYGRVPGGAVSCVGLRTVAPPPPGLVTVDWCRAETFES